MVACSPRLLMTKRSVCGMCRAYRNSTLSQDTLLRFVVWHGRQMEACSPRLLMIKPSVCGMCRAYRNSPPSQDILLTSTAWRGRRMVACSPRLLMTIRSVYGMCRAYRNSPPSQDTLLRFVVWHGRQMEACSPRLLMTKPSTCGMGKQDNIDTRLRAIPLPSPGYPSLLIISSWPRSPLMQQCGSGIWILGRRWQFSMSLLQVIYVVV